LAACTPTSRGSTRLHGGFSSRGTSFGSHRRTPSELAMTAPPSWSASSRWSTNGEWIWYWRWLSYASRATAYRLVRDEEGAVRASAARRVPAGFLRRVEGDHQAD